MRIFEIFRKATYFINLKNRSTLFSTLKTVLSDEEMYCTLENVIETISLHVAVKRPSSFPDQEIMTQLQLQGYNPKTSWAFQRACYWYLVDNGIMVVDAFVRYHLIKKITSDTKTDICMEILSEYEPYLQANYARSLIEPNPYWQSEKAPDCSPRFKLNF